MKKRLDEEKKTVKPRVRTEENKQNRENIIKKSEIKERRKIDESLVKLNTLSKNKLFKEKEKETQRKKIEPFKQKSLNINIK